MSARRGAGQGSGSRIDHLVTQHAAPYAAPWRPGRYKHPNGVGCSPPTPGAHGVRSPGRQVEPETPFQSSFSRPKKAPLTKTEADTEGLKANIKEGTQSAIRRTSTILEGTAQTTKHIASKLPEQTSNVTEQIGEGISQGAEDFGDAVRNFSVKAANATAAAAKEFRSSITKRAGQVNKDLSKRVLTARTVAQKLCSEKVFQGMHDLAGSLQTSLQTFKRDREHWEHALSDDWMH